MNRVRNLFAVSNLATIALVIGGCVAILTVAVGFMAYRYSRSAVLDVAAEHNLRISRTVINTVNAALDESSEINEREVVLAIEQQWKRTVTPPGSYLCVINSSGRLLFHTLKPDMVGTDVSGAIVDLRDDSKTLVGDLLATRSSHAGINTNFRGITQIAGYAYFEPINSLVVTHLPLSRIDTKIANVIVPWGVSLGFTAGVILPLALFVMHSCYRRAEFRTQQANLALADREWRLQSSNERLHLALEAAHAGIFHWDFITNEVNWSEGHFLLHGYQPNEVPISYEEWASRVHLDDLPFVQAAINRAKDEHVDYDGDYRVIWPDGSIHWIHGRGRFVYDDNGKAVRMFGVVSDADERIATQRALHEREATLRGFFQNASIMMGVVEIDGDRITNVTSNSAAHDFLNVNVDSTVGRHDAFVAREYEDHWLVRFREAQRTGRPVNFEYEHQRGMQTHWLAITVDLISGTTEDRSRFCYVVVDRTEHEDTIRQLRESEMKFSAAFYSGPLPMAIITSDSYFVEVNESFCELVKFSSGELIGKTADECGILGSSQCKDVLDSIARDGKSVRNIEHRLRAKDGEFRDVVYSVEPITVQGETLLLATSIDITERKRALAALYKSESLFRSSFEDAATPMTLQDPKGRFLRVNDAFCRLVGRTKDDLLTMSYHDLTHRDDLSVDERLNRVLLEGTDVPLNGKEKRYLRPDNKHVWAMVSASLVRDEDGQPRYRVVQAQDITERKAAESRVLELNSKLEQRVADRTRELSQANDDLEAYAHTVAHDLRAPLRALIGFATALREDYGNKLETEGNEYVDFIESAAKELEDLTSDLLEYGKLGRGKAANESIDVDQVVERALELVATQIKEKDASVEVMSPLGHAIGNRRLLTQTLSNLISNAVKFVSPDVTPVVKIRAEHQEGACRIFVIDNGVGIDMSFSEQIFGVFERLHGVESYPGTGIGLAIVRRAMESMSGSFGVESEPGKGSCFWIELRSKNESGADRLNAKRTLQIHGANDRKAML